MGAPRLRLLLVLAAVLAPVLGQALEAECKVRLAACGAQGVQGSCSQGQDRDGGGSKGWWGLRGTRAYITHLQQCSTAVSWGAKGPAAALCSALEGRLQQRQTFVNVNIAAASGGVAVTHPIASASAASLLAVHPPSRPVLLPATIPQGRVFGNRIPRRYIVVTGYGETDQGSGSDPFETGEGASTKGRQLQRGRAPGWAV